MSSRLEAHNVTHHFGPVLALDDVSVEVAAGNTVALVGESGSGKTTLLRCFNRLTEPERGEVRVGSANVCAEHPVELRRRIGYVQQHGGLLPHWRVLRNVALVPVLTGMRDATDAAVRALELVGLPVSEFADRFPHELSGGQRQRVALARSIAARPEVVLLDEPFGALDAISRGELQETFDALRRELSITTLLVTHDLAEAARLADQIVVMKSGRVEQTASARVLVSAPATDYVARLVARARAGLESLSSMRSGIAVLFPMFLALTSPSSGQSSARPHAVQQRPVIVASKPFGESYLLCEMFAQVLEANGLSVERRPGLGATQIAFGALRANAIDVYPEYTGTGLTAILHDSLSDSLAADPGAAFALVSRRFAELYNVRWLPPLGFQNTYAIAVTRATAARYHLRTLTDLARESQNLTAGFTADFIGRSDGLIGLSRVYGIHPRTVRPLAPAVKYQALVAGGVDVIDGYSTDGLLSKYDLVTLSDDKHFFPPYEAAAVTSPDLNRRAPAAIAALTLLSGRLDETTMRRLNRRVEVDGEDVHRVAADELARLGLIAHARTGASASRGSEGSFAGYMWNRRVQLVAMTGRHVMLVAIALFAAVVIALPLGLALERARGAAESVIGGLGVLQTIPSIALLAFMIPLFGVGVLPALVALWLYALYPIARGTYTGVRDADPDAVTASEALGTTAVQRLMWVRLPLAAPVIMAGIRTAAVITVGAATLAAFIGAGGLGEPIVEGLALADTRMILSGALPAAILALAIDALLGLIERLVAPAHRRRSMFHHATFASAWSRKAAARTRP